ncbi:hypothetical protein DL769_007331 [Monosporascus sp. CRB-8-3]|nr:hypothetical protein DL769_007331 [Monosporascus sp. CRB-8-3]
MPRSRVSKASANNDESPGISTPNPKEDLEQERMRGCGERASAADASEISARLYETEMILAIEQWKEEDGGDDTKGWRSTPKAHRIVDKMKAAHFEKMRYRQQAEKIERGGPLRHAYQALFP